MTYNPAPEGAGAFSAPDLRVVSLSALRSWLDGRAVRLRSPAHQRVSRDALMDWMLCLPAASPVAVPPAPAPAPAPGSIPVDALNTWLASQRNPVWLRSDAVREFVASQPSLGKGGNATGSILRDANGRTALHRALRGVAALRAILPHLDGAPLTAEDAAWIMVCNMDAGPGVPVCTALGQRMLDAACRAETLVEEGDLLVRWNPFYDLELQPAGEHQPLSGADLFDEIRGLVWLPGEGYPCPVHVTWCCPYAGQHPDDGLLRF